MEPSNDEGMKAPMTREEARILLGYFPSAFWVDPDDPLGWAKRPVTPRQAYDLIEGAKTDPELASILDAHDVTGCSVPSAAAAKILRRYLYARHLEKLPEGH